LSTTGDQRHYEPIDLTADFIFPTEYDEGDRVTFTHESHVKDYELDCADCHVQQTCEGCHARDGERHPFGRPGERNLHDTCFRCHSEENCDECHREAGD
jgi:hypothetical protein